MEPDDEPRVLPGWSVSPPQDFEQAVEAVLAHLASEVLSTWMLVRAEGEEGLVLSVAGDAACVTPGSTFRWADSMSARMVREGPNAAGSTAAVESYRDVPWVLDGRVGAFLGVPICRTDGTLFGVLAGIAPRAVNDDLASHVPVVELLGRLLGALLSADLRETVDARQVERVQVNDMYDSVTGLGDRTYWDRVIAAEEARCRRYGDHAAVVVLELDDYDDIVSEHGTDAAQVLLRRAARVLRTQCREEDVIARVAPGMFGVLSVGADADGAAMLTGRLQTQLDDNAVHATLRFRARDPLHGLAHAWRSAASALSVEARRPA